MRRYVLGALSLVVLLGCQTVPRATQGQIQVKKLPVNGVELAYVEEGHGDSVLFVHGACGDWRNWEGVRPFIAARYRFVALSRRYHYPNVWNDDGRNYTMAQHVEDVAAFIRALRVGPVHLVGGSWGGNLVARLALKYPELVRTVVMSDPAGLMPSPLPEGKAASSAYGKDIAESKAAALGGDSRKAAILLFNAVEGSPDAFSSASSGSQQRFLENARTLAPMYSAAPASPVQCQELKALKVPAMVMRGEHTRDNFRFGDDAALACLPPGTPSNVVPDARHIWYSVAAKEGAEAITRFLERH